MSEFTITPVEGESYEGHQWGYEIKLAGFTFARAWTGGTGPCWNIDLEPNDDEEQPIHVCDLDELIAALQALRESDAYRENEERWA